LKSEADEMMSDIPWKRYIAALDASNTGLLNANMQPLVIEIDSSCKLAGYEIDLVAFVPSWDRAIGKLVIEKPLQKDISERRGNLSQENHVCAMF
jgi:uncharacterized protein involved in tellurium resistance